MWAVSSRPAPSHACGPRRRGTDGVGQEEHDRPDTSPTQGRTECVKRSLDRTLIRTHLEGLAYRFDGFEYETEIGADLLAFPSSWLSPRVRGVRFE